MKTWEEHLYRLREVFSTEVITVKEASAYCGVDYRTLKSAPHTPVKQIGKHYKVPLINLAKYLGGNE